MAMAADVSAEAAFGRRTINTITWRLMPLLMLLYLVAYIDRQNVSYAKLEMVGDLGLSETAYGLGASLLYRLLPVRSAVKRYSRARRRARLVRTHHGELGHRHPASRFHQEPDDVLYPALLVGCGGGGLLSRRSLRADLMVPAGLSRPYDRLVHDRQRHRQRGRRGDRRRAARSRRPLGFMAGNGCSSPPARPRSCLPASCYSILPEGRSKARWLDERDARLADRHFDARARGNGAYEHANPFRALLDKRVILLALLYVGFPLAAYG